jgi:hypothetical protein
MSDVTGDLALDENGRVSPVYSLRETISARDQLDLLAGKSNQFRELWEAITWTICRSPEVGTPVPGVDRAYMFKSRDFLNIGIPVLLVIYRIIPSGELVLEVVGVLESE